MELFDYTGVIHVHSAFSFDGRTPVGDIIAAAGHCGLDFLMLTDHSCLSAKEQNLEGWHGDTLLIVGQEIAPRFNHYLAFQTDRPIEIHKDDTDTDPQTYIDLVNAAGGMGFIAHPDHKGTALFHVKHYPWINWNVTGYTGLGIWDFMTDFQNSLNGYVRSFLSYLFPGLFLRGPESETLTRWDELNRHGRIVGIGESDNHNTLKRFLGFTLAVFPFRKAFRFIRTHVLTEKPLSRITDKDTALILSALKAGRAYVANDSFRTTRGFSFWITDGQQQASLGDDYSLRGKSLLHVRTPAKAKIRIIRDGSLWYEALTDTLTREVDEIGVYRVEAYMKLLGNHRPWIFSNPIFVRRPGYV